MEARTIGPVHDAAEVFFWGEGEGGGARTWISKWANVYLNSLPAMPHTFSDTTHNQNQCKAAMPVKWFTY